ncbi:MAG: hypothetical protein MGU50_05765 [Trichodesmium sp. MAG_R02]|jgi:hypothetical protein|nr:hypothetical protein [Trichodesmium sp. MAG_R02]
MSIENFHKFVRNVTTSKSSPAKKSSPSVSGILSGFDHSLTGEAKGIAVMKKLVEAAKAEGFDVTFDDVKQFVQDMKAKYETDPMYADMIDSYCNSTCHLGSVVGKK